MKKKLLIASLIVLSTTFSFAQCSSVQSSVSSSTSTMVQMYSNAKFLILPGDSNLYCWELKDFNNNVLVRDSTTSQFLVINFTATLTDSLIICQTVKNSVTGISCIVCDTLAYGGSIVNWELISSNTAGHVSLNSIEKIEAKIYPNPTSNFINIEIGKQVDYTATLYNAIGKEIFSGKNFKRFDMNNLPKGVYFLEIQGVDSNKKVTKKVVKL